MNEKFANQVGLVEAGFDDEGNKLWVGAEGQWRMYAVLELMWEKRGISPIQPRNEYAEEF